LRLGGLGFNSRNNLTALQQSSIAIRQSSILHCTCFTKPTQNLSPVVSSFTNGVVVANYAVAPRLSLGLAIFLGLKSKALACRRSCDSLPRPNAVKMKRLFTVKTKGFLIE
jgi:hypothetical protein